MKDFKQTQVTNIIAEIKIINHQYGKGASIFSATFIDFRGRIYNPANIGHQGGKVGKHMTNAIISKAVDMEEIKINIAANMSYKDADGTWVEMEKASREEKADFFEANIDIVVDTAADFNSHMSVIANYDDPMMFIKVARDYAQSIITGQSNIIIPFDGTISGIQHFAAITKSSDMAKWVNISSSNKRFDAYIEVANRVKSTDFNDEFINAAIQFVDRKTVKSSVMTTAYGSGRDPAVKGVKKNSRMMNFIYSSYEAGSDEANNIIKVIADAITSTRMEIVGDAIRAMDIIKGVTESIHDNGAVAVVSHFGFKFHNDKFMMDTDGRSVRNVAGQTSAIAPGFVHYSDAHHMHRVINAAAAEGITVTPIHDSFGVVSKDAKRINEIVREQFVIMYSGSNHLAQFVESNKENISKEAYDTAMADIKSLMGDYDVSDIMGNPYAFS